LTLEAETLRVWAIVGTSGKLLTNPLLYIIIGNSDFRLACALITPNLPSIDLAPKWAKMTPKKKSNRLQRRIWHE
jgi:hypothetical protein